MKRKSIYSTKHLVPVIVMILALVWLTVSLPFVFEAQQQLRSQQNPSHNIPETENKGSNPFSNTTEEKVESGVNNLSEYLHEVHSMQHLGEVIKSYYKCHPSDLYYAFHPELLSPPPEA